MVIYTTTEERHFCCLFSPGMWGMNTVIILYLALHTQIYAVHYKTLANLSQYKHYIPLNMAHSYANRKNILMEKLLNEWKGNRKSFNKKT